LIRNTLLYTGNKKGARLFYQLTSFKANSHTNSCVVDGIADEEKLKDLMREILLSLYVIYGQTPKSQQSFNGDDVFPGVESGQRDSLLQEICRGQWKFRSFRQRPKRIYNIRTDFPILGAKILFITNQARLQEPTNLVQLWRDQRNTLQWWTFWAVITFGAIGTILAIIQTILAGLQVRYVSLAGDSPM
jgi:hypothetical protein